VHGGAVFPSHGNRVRVVHALNPSSP